MATATRRRTKPAPVVEPEPEVIEDELEDELEDLDETEDDGDAFEDVEEDDEEAEDDLEELEDEVEEVEAKPAPKKGTKAAAAKKTTSAKAQGSGNDSNWLAAYVNEQTGKTYDARSMRILLRKLAKAGTLPREVGVDRGRYDFPAGASDPVVKAVVKMVREGALEQEKSDGLARAREAKAAKAQAAKAAETTAPAKATKKAAPAAAKATKATAAKATKAAPAKRSRTAAKA